MRILIAFVFTASFGCGDAATNNAANRPQNANTNGRSSNSMANAMNSASNTAVSNSLVNTRPQATPLPAQVKKDDGLFSFPPPRAVDVYEVDRKLFDELGAPHPTLAQASDVLSNLLKAAGYEAGKFAYFSNSVDEFAIVTTMERINEDGSPVADRFEVMDGLPSAHGLGQYTEYLVSGKRVYYRVFAIIVSNKEYDFFEGSSPSFSMAKRWMRKGKRNLPATGPGSLVSVQMDESYRCYVLLYLFVNHTSLDAPTAVDDLSPTDERLKLGLNLSAENHIKNSGWRIER